MNKKKTFRIVIGVILIIIIFGKNGSEVQERRELNALSDIELIENNNIKLFDEFNMNEYKKMTKIYKKDARIAFDKYNDSVIINAETLPDTGKDSRSIRILTFHIKNSTDDNIKNMSLDKAIKIIQDNMPKKIIEEYYKNPETYKIKKKTNPDKNTYVMMFTLLDEKKHAGHKFPGVVSAYITENIDGTIDSITMRTFAPRWMRPLNSDVYDRDEWDIK